MADTRPTFRPSSTSWSTDANWDSGVAPVANDFVIFDYLSNAYAVVTPVAPDNNIDLDGILVAEGYSQNLGTSGTPLDIYADEVLHRGGGTIYYASGAGGTTDSFIVDSSQSGSGGLAASLSGTAIAQITCLRGRTVIESGLANAFGLTVSGAAYVEIEAGAGNDSQTLKVSGGQLTNDNAASSLIMTNGVCYQNTGTLGATQIRGGTLFLNHRSIVDGTAIITSTVEISDGGTLDLTQRPKGLTITGPITLGRGGTIREAYAGQLSVTNGIKGGGGRRIVAP